jgi:hypothetical protein
VCASASLGPTRPFGSKTPIAAPRVKDARQRCDQPLNVDWRGCSRLWWPASIPNPKAPASAAPARRIDVDQIASALVAYGAGQLHCWQIGACAAAIGRTFNSAQATVSAAVLYTKFGGQTRQSAPSAARTRWLFEILMQRRFISTTWFDY